jgi:hypothetical protein
MTTSIFANPGQRIAISLQVVDGYGALHDGYQAPTVDFVSLPNGSFLSGYPAVMSQVSPGIWRYFLTLPTGFTSLGSYLVSCSWPHPDTSIFQNELFIINVAMPFGNTTILPA